MNKTLSEGEVDRCLRALEYALVLARGECDPGSETYALLDAVHNLPRLLLEPNPGQRSDETPLGHFADRHLKSLFKGRPELRGSALDILDPRPVLTTV